VKILRGFKTELDPNDVQRTSMLKHAGTARFAYNWGLERSIQARKDGEKRPTSIDLHKQWNEWKRENAPWWTEVSKCAPQEALRNLDQAYKHFFRRCKQKTKRKGFPRFKSKNRGIGSFRLTGSIRVSETHVTLPRIGTVRLKEREYLPTDVDISSVTVSERAGRWFVSLKAEVENQDLRQKDEDHPVVGVDLGVKTLATVSDGTTFENPKALQSKLRKLQRLQRSLSRKDRGSNKRRKTRERVAKLHWQIANVRMNALHQVTTHLARTKRVVVIEDLNVSGMMRNGYLARAISDVGMYEFRRLLEYKGEWYDCDVVVADRYFSSSKTCSECGWINDGLKLSDRMWKCLECEVMHDRDFNASVNLENWGMFAASSAENANARGGNGSDDGNDHRETTPVEAGIRHQVSHLGKF